MKYLIEKYKCTKETESIIYQANTISLSNPKWYKSLFSIMIGRKYIGSESIKIFYPTSKEFKECGIDGEAVSIILNGQRLPNEILYRAKDCSGNSILLHSKCIFPNTMSWIYIGSHNLTRAAWGDMLPDSYPQNFEIGIFVPPNICKTMNITIPFDTDLESYSNRDIPGGVIRS